jgi:hypothetical protein
VPVPPAPAADGSAVAGAPAAAWSPDPDWSVGEPVGVDWSVLGVDWSVLGADWSVLGADWSVGDPVPD